jgi:hypothetical protein
MNQLSRNTLLSCLLVLAACANQEQGQVATPGNLPELVVGKAAEPVAIDARPALADKEVKSGRLKQKDELAAGTASAPARSEERVAAHGLS